jgi:hypothetical protein
MNAGYRVVPDVSGPSTYEAVCVSHRDPGDPDGPRCALVSGELRSPEAVDRWITAHASVTAHLRYRRSTRDRARVEWDRGTDNPAC